MNGTQRHERHNREFWHKGPVTCTRPAKTSHDLRKHRWLTLASVGGFRASRGLSADWLSTGEWARNQLGVRDRFLLRELKRAAQILDDLLSGRVRVIKTVDHHRGNDPLTLTR